MNRPSRSRPLTETNTSTFHPVSRRLRHQTRPHYNESSDSSSPLLHQAHSAVSSQNSIDSVASSKYTVRSILQQRSNSDEEVEYLLDWADDPTTGQQYSPTWEPRANVSRSLEANWLREQQHHQRDSSGVESTKSSSASQSYIKVPTTALYHSANSQIDDIDKGSNREAGTQCAGDKWSNLKNKAHIHVRQRRVIESSASPSSPLTHIPPNSTRRILRFRAELPDSSPTQTGESSIVCKIPREADRIIADQSESTASQDIDPSTSLENSSLLNPSADYNPSSSLSIHRPTPDTASGASIVNNRLQSSLQSIQSSSSLVSSGDGLPPSNSEAHPLVSRTGSNPFRHSTHTPRRFSPSAVIPDSQDSISLLPLSSLRNSINQVSLYAETVIIVSISPIKCSCYHI